ncbi:MAG TPA: aminotransferase class V-fold PLP-dependent enzyme [Polyangia bacterium]|jgi:cysteine desulfurase/selenocysteine lyase
MTGAPGLDLAAAVRADFPLLARAIDGRPLIYLDSAATSLRPALVAAALDEHYRTRAGNVHRGKHLLGQEVSGVYEEGRARIAAFIGARSDEIVFVRNTTEALNLVAHGLGLGGGDLVLVAADSHHSNLLPWRAVARTAIVRVDGAGRLDLDHYRALLRERPRVVAITHCSNVTGLYAPVEALVAAAQNVGALVVLDAAQSAPHRALRAASLGVDFLAFSGHKMLGPTGIGVLYGRAERLATLAPLMLGGGTVDWVTDTELRLRRSPLRFEAGTPNIDGVVGLVAAVDYLERLGLDAVERHEREMAAALVAGARELPALQVLGATAGVDRGGLLSLALPGRRDLSELARMLCDSYGIVCRSGHLCAQPLVDQLTAGEVLRASTYLYTTRADVAAFFAALRELCALTAA